MEPELGTFRQAVDLLTRKEKDSTMKPITELVEVVRETLKFSDTPESTDDILKIIAGCPKLVYGVLQTCLRFESEEE